jgi:hypothetical protein
VDYITYVRWLGPRSVRCEDRKRIVDGVSDLLGGESNFLRLLGSAHAAAAEEERKCRASRKFVLHSCMQSTNYCYCSEAHVVPYRNRNRNGIIRTLDLNSRTFSTQFPRWIQIQVVVG